MIDSRVLKVCSAISTNVNVTEYYYVADDNFVSHQDSAPAHRFGATYCLSALARKLRDFISAEHCAAPNTDSHQTERPNHRRNLAEILGVPKYDLQACTRPTQSLCL